MFGGGAQRRKPFERGSNTAPVAIFRITLEAGQRHDFTGTNPRLYLGQLFLPLRQVDTVVLGKQSLGVCAGLQSPASVAANPQCRQMFVSDADVITTLRERGLGEPTNPTDCVSAHITQDRHSESGQERQIGLKGSTLVSDRYQGSRILRWARCFNTCRQMFRLWRDPTLLTRCGSLSPGIENTPTQMTDAFWTREYYLLLG